MLVATSLRQLAVRVYSCTQQRCALFLQVQRTGRTVTLCNNITWQTTTQYLLVNGQSSGPVVVNCSIPQDSVLGPINFITYTEDVSTVFHWHRVRHHLYADDKQTYTDVVSVEDVSSGRCVLQHCISELKGDMQRFFTKLMKSSF